MQSFRNRQSEEAAPGHRSDRRAEAEGFLALVRMQGRLAEGETALKASPKDAQARFGLGTVQFLQGSHHT